MNTLEYTAEATLGYIFALKPINYGKDLLSHTMG